MLLRKAIATLSLMMISMAAMPADLPSFTLIYTGNLDGELEPCGCSEGGNKGGIKRQATMIDKLRQQQPELFLLSAGGLLASEVPQDKIKSQFILEGVDALKYDAIGIQWRDLAYGTDFFKSVKTSYVVSNWNSTEFAPSKDITHNNTTIAYFSWLDPNEDPAKAMSKDQRIVNRDNAKLQAALVKAKQEKKITFVATTLNLKQAQTLFSLDNIDILMVKAKYEVYGEPTLEGHTLVLTPGSRGMRLGKLDIHVDNAGHIGDWKHEVIPLADDVADAPRLQDWYNAYNAALKTDYQARTEQRKAIQSGKSPYASAEACEKCHPAEFAKWSGSAHSQAFFKLQDVNKAFDPFCVRCHSLGFEKDGGYIDAMLTPKLMHVQCENCHGAAREHAENPAQNATANKQWQAQERCAQCHVQKHSPDFKFEVYWPKIAHGKNAVAP